jgi:hypothetical protein
VRLDGWPSWPALSAGLGGRRLRVSEPIAGWSHCGPEANRAPLVGEVRHHEGPVSGVNVTLRGTGPSSCSGRLLHFGR